MKWFEGSIPSAIAEAKSRNAIFVVYITGLDDTSKDMDATWNHAAVQGECQKENMVVIKVDAQSETCTQFSAIYPVVCVPSVFFIGGNGVPIEITGGQKSPEDFVKVLQKVSQMHRGGSPAPQPEAATGSPTTVPAAGEPQPSSSSNTDDDISKEEKIKRAQELIEQKRLAKTEEEKEKERQKEVDRRKLGQEVNKLKDWKEDRNMKETHDQLKKEREEDKQARERVREQIARDRADRATKYQKDKAERDQAQQEKQTAKLAAKQEAMAKETARKSEHSRLQFRLTDGSFVTQQFSSQDPLQYARDYIAQHLGRPPTSLSLSTTYPRRLFNEGDMSQTMADLGLAPSAVMMVLSGSTRAASRPSNTGSGSSQGFVALLLAPFLYIWAIICSVFMGSSPPRSRLTQTPTEPQPETSQSSSPSNTRSRLQNQPSNLRQEGNIHRLTDEGMKDDDDDMGTWNGNSTQQM